MEKEELLKKVKDYVPFRKEDSTVRWGGFHVPVDGSWTRVHRWEGGIEKEGQLLLNKDGELIGKVYHVYSSGVAGTKPYEELEEYPQEEACYLLYYNIAFDPMRDEDYACLYELV